MLKSDHYSVGYNKNILKWFSRRSAYVDAKFILPYLQPGLSLTRRVYCETIANQALMEEVVSEYIIQQWHNSAFAKKAVELGWVDDKIITQYCLEWSKFARSQGRFFSWNWCQSMGRKPNSLLNAQL
jgi:hypothetical protein